MSEFSKLGLGGVDPTVNPTFQNDLGNEYLLSLVDEEEPSTLKSIEAIDNLKKIPGLQELYERDKNASLLKNLNTFRDPPSKEITDYQNFLTKSPDFVSFDEYQRNKNLASKGIMQNFSEQDLDEIGEGADFVSYDKLRNMGLSDAGTTPQLGELTGFIDPLATMTARERQLKNLFDK